MSNSLARVLLALQTVLFGGFGVAASVAPAWLAGHVDIALPTPDASADFAAIYGGLELGLAAFLALCMVRGRLQTGLTAAGLMLGGIAVVRAAHLVIGGGSAMLFGALAAEAAGATLSLWIARRTGDQPAPAE